MLQRCLRALFKAPGPDGIPVEIIQLLVEDRPAVLKDIFNEALKTADIPKRWKSARLVLIEKPRKANEKTTYRPICLLDSMAKLLEMVLKDRLEAEIESRATVWV